MQKRKNEEFTLLHEGDQLPETEPVEVYLPDSEKNPAERERVIDVATNSEEVGSTLAVMDNPNSLMALAIREKSPVEALERLIAMRKEWRAEQAKEAFDRAMAQFQSECPTIKKTKAGAKTQSGSIVSYYAPIESIVDQVKIPLRDNGFSYSTQQEFLQGDMVKISIRVRHKAGHSEVTEMTVPLGTKTGVMTATQQVAAASTFAKRYAFCNAFGILTGDTDTDAQEPSQPRFTPRQAPSEPTPDDYSDQDTYAPSTGNYEGDAFAEVEYPKTSERLATLKQMNYIKTLRSERGEDEMDMRTLTTSQASNEIERLLQIKPLNKQV